ncbi:hypothetical protein DPV78_000490 [Talaromyces pinophilus]|nr:hypothetical protein DPV78_000490 [Talaromyces pinophilus]
MEAMGPLDVLISMQAIWCFHHESCAKPCSSDDFLAGESKTPNQTETLSSNIRDLLGNTRNEVVQILHDELPN